MTHAPESADPSPFDADAVYLQKTLRHEPMELGLDDSVSPRTLLILLVRAYLASAIIFFGLGFIAFYEISHGNGNGQTVFYADLILSAVVFWGVLLGSKVTEPIGEWRTLLANRGGQSEGYYRMMRKRRPRS